MSATWRKRGGRDEVGIEKRGEGREAALAMIQSQTHIFVLACMKNSGSSQQDTFERLGGIKPQTDAKNSFVRRAWCLHPTSTNGHTKDAQIILERGGARLGDGKATPLCTSWPHPLTVAKFSFAILERYKKDQLKKLHEYERN
jgi:hypothetical protein